jgi:hypothetical protein
MKRSKSQLGATAQIRSGADGSCRLSVSLFCLQINETTGIVVSSKTTTPLYPHKHYTNKETSNHLPISTASPFNPSNPKNHAPHPVALPWRSKLGFISFMPENFLSFAAVYGG